MKNLTILAFIVVSLGCTSLSQEPVSMPDQVGREPLSSHPLETFDLPQLQRQLKMDRAPEDLGFSEKIFNSCHLPRPSKKCGARYFTVLNVQLKCRDTEGTTDIVVTNFTPLQSQQIIWRLGRAKGISRSDASGYSQILIVHAQSLRSERLVLTVSRQFLGIEVTQNHPLVLPRYWCDAP